MMIFGCLSREEGGPDFVVESRYRRKDGDFGLIEPEIG